MSDTDAKLAALFHLARARSAPFEKLQQDAYLDVLDDISVEGLLAACRLLARRPRADYEPLMPTAGDIRRAVREAREASERERDDSLRRLVAPSEEQESRYRCATCRDTGWQEHRCAGYPNHSCGRPQAKLRCYPHPYVTPCACGQRASKAS